MRKRVHKIIRLLLCSAVTISALTACAQNVPTPSASEETLQEANVDEVISQELSASDEISEIDSILENMSLRDKVEQMMVVSYRIWEEVPDEDTSSINQTVENTEADNPKINVIELNEELRNDLRAHHYGGMVLFAENYQDAEQTLRLVADMQGANQEGGGLPLLIATDQEGGNVARITFGTTGVGNMALAATGDPANAKAMAAVYGEELGLLGINTDFAPVMDINNNSNNPVIGVRSFGDSPEEVSKYGLAYMEGLKETGTIATLKHFPGHGNTDTDSHTGFPCITSTYDELKAFELIPFQQAIDAGADMIMTAHIQYPQIETTTYSSISTGEEVYLPATMSRTILTDILRDDMGFEGVVVTDALDMAAITENFETEDILKYTMNSGVNMLLLPIITDAALFQKTQDMVDMAVALAEAGEIDEAQIDDSVRRILTLKAKYGILDQTDFTVTDEQVRAALDGIGSSEHRETAWEIAKKALTLVKNENEAFPLHTQQGENTLILFADTCASRIGTGELAKEKLLEDGLISDESEITLLVNTTENEEECVEAAKEADHTILVYRTYGAACLDPSTGDGFSSAVFDRIIKELHEEGKPAVLISCQLPYDADRFREADAILLTYNSAVMRVIPPESGAGSAYAPNLLAGIYACFTEEEITGQTPVTLPSVNEQYKLVTAALAKTSVIDYADKTTWAYYGIGEDRNADLFLVCPTVDMNDEFNMSLDDEDTRTSFLGALNMERGIYEDSTRMFAPYYRQAAMKVYSLDRAEWEPYMELAYSDVSAAFAYYLEHENDGRPIVLAGFSQGADMCYRLLEEYFDDETLYDQLVAVYAIGWPLTEEMTQTYPQIVAAQASDDTGVVISFDCEAPEVTETFINPADQRALSINPLSWTTDVTPADKSLNLGACFTRYSGEIRSETEALCGCYIDASRGVVKVTDIDPADYAPIVPGLPEGGYHVYDYQFFFRNLQQNVKDRVEAYLEDL